jgi:hypothetical protein
MKSSIPLLCIVCCASAAELPSGTAIGIRLKTKVSSTASKANDPIEAVVIKPVMSGDRFVIPYGAVIKGQVAKAQPSEASDKRATLELTFNQLVAAHGKTIKLTSKITDVENARETVDDNGAIQGILASETLSARMDQGLSKLGEHAQGLADILQIAKAAVVKTTDSEIAYGPGVEMTLALSSKLTIDPSSVPGMTIKLQPIAAESRLHQLVNAQPFQTVAAKPPKESDMTNLMFIGSEQQVEAAFAAAGWSAARGLNKLSALETFQAIAEMRGYKEAPMSVLLLDGRPAELNYEKQNNTFAQRHHLRIWRRPVTWEGQEVWVASSTHDTGIDFSPENRTFIHKVDSHIDDERAKVVSDFLFTGAVKSLALVERPKVPTESMNATGDKLLTDGRMAVLILK